jgi:hypothetical protein
VFCFCSLWYTQSLCQLGPLADIQFFINDLGVHSADMPAKAQPAVAC